MSKINIKMLTEDALVYLRNNPDSISKMIKENENNSWINSTIPQPMFVEKKLQIDDFELTDNPESSDKNIDFENSKALYESLKVLPRYILCDERFWLWLHFEKFYSVVRQMMKVKGKSTFTDHWLQTRGVRRGLMFGVLSRCYFRVALTIDDKAIDKYSLTKWVIDNPERYRNLTWRSFSSEEHLVRGVLKGEKQAVDEFKGKENSDVYPEIAKYVSIIGSVRLLDMMTEDDIQLMIYNKTKDLLLNGVK